MDLKDVSFKSKSEYVGQGRFNWEIHVEADDRTLDNINYIRYKLHKTFPNRIRDIYDRDSHFRLETNGWGEFIIRIIVILKDGKKLETEHYLKLDWDSVPDEDQDLLLE
jgi:transcription initiation factor IIF auxiliary subunit